MPQELPADSSLATDWNSEYNFWHKIISEEVERLRWNEGYEPFSVDLYQMDAKYAPPFLGTTQIGHVKFNVTGNWDYDSNGKKVLRISARKVF